MADQRNAVKHVGKQEQGRRAHELVQGGAEQIRAVADMCFDTALRVALQMRVVREWCGWNTDRGIAQAKISRSHAQPPGGRN